MCPVSKTCFSLLCACVLVCLIFLFIWFLSVLYGLRYMQYIYIYIYTYVYINLYADIWLRTHTHMHMHTDTQCRLSTKNWRPILGASDLEHLSPGGDAVAPASNFEGALSEENTSWVIVYRVLHIFLQLSEETRDFRERLPTWHNFKAISFDYDYIGVLRNAAIMAGAFNHFLFPRGKGWSP